MAEGASPRAVRLAAADEDRRLAIAVTGGAAALLPAELLAGAGDVAPLAGGAGRAAALFELPGNDAVQAVRARVDAEDDAVKVAVGASLAIGGLNLALPDQAPFEPAGAPGPSPVSST